VTRRVLLENGQLVPNGENLCLKGASDHDPTNDRNFCVFRPDGVFGNHNV
jgi:hypothetical protein